MFTNHRTLTDTWTSQQKHKLTVYPLWAKHVIKDDQLSVFTGRNLAEVTRSDGITFDWHSEERRLTRFHLRGQQLCKLREQKKVYVVQQLLQYWFAWGICVLDTYMVDVKNVMWRHLSIAGLHVKSRRPCWWSRTKAFLSTWNFIFVWILWKTCFELATNTTYHNYSIIANTLTSNGSKARKTKRVTKKNGKKNKRKRSCNFHFVSCR